MNISFNYKGNRVYARFRDPQNGYKELHLPVGLDSAIRMLQYTFKTRDYINKGLATEEDFERLAQRLRENLK